MLTDELVSECLLSEHTAGLTKIYSVNLLQLINKINKY